MRKLRIGLGLALGFFVVVAPVAAQSAGDAPKVEVSLGYTYVRAKTVVAAGCCFNMNGGSLSVAFRANNWLSLVGDFGAYYQGNVLNTGLTLSVFPYTFGPRISLRKSKRFTPYVQALFGGGHAGGTTYTRSFHIGSAPPIPRNAFAMELGGGIDANVSRHFAIRLAQVDYLFTNFPDGATNQEHNLRVTTGLVFHF